MEKKEERKKKERFANSNSKLKRSGATGGLRAVALRLPPHASGSQSYAAPLCKLLSAHITTRTKTPTSEERRKKKYICNVPPKSTNDLIVARIVAPPHHRNQSMAVPTRFDGCVAPHHDLLAPPPPPPFDRQPTQRHGAVHSLCRARAHARTHTHACTRTHSQQIRARPALVNVKLAHVPDNVVLLDEQCSLERMCVCRYPWIHPRATIVNGIRKREKKII